MSSPSGYHARFAAHCITIRRPSPSSTSFVHHCLSPARLSHRSRRRLPIGRVAFFWHCYLQVINMSSCSNTLCLFYWYTPSSSLPVTLIIPRCSHCSRQDRVAFTPLYGRFGQFIIYVVFRRVVAARHLRGQVASAAVCSSGRTRQLMTYFIGTSGFFPSCSSAVRTSVIPVDTRHRLGNTMLRRQHTPPAYTITQHVTTHCSSSRAICHYFRW